MLPVMNKQVGGLLLGTLLSDALAGIEVNDRNQSEFMELIEDAVAHAATKV